MQLFLDTTDTAVLRELAATGLVDGVTTNPSLIMKSGRPMLEVIAEIRAVYDNYEFDTEILAASIRTPDHVKRAAIIGADCATIPPAVFRELFKHPLTEKGLEQFLGDWAKTGQSIL